MSTPSETPHRSGRTTVSSQRDRGEVESALRRRLRLDAAEIADGANSDASGRTQGGSRTIDLLRVDGLSSQRERQLVARYHREREEESHRGTNMWGDIEGEFEDGRALLPPPPRANTAQRWRRPPFGPPPEDAPAPGPSRAEARRSASSMSHARDGALDRIEAIRASRLRAQRLQMQSELPSLADFRSQGYMSWFRRGQRGLGDYMVCPSFVRASASVLPAHRLVYSER